MYVKIYTGYSWDWTPALLDMNHMLYHWPTESMVLLQSLYGMNKTP